MIEFNRDDFLSYLTDFSHFILERNCRKLLDTVRTGQNGPFERGCRWFQIFFMGFQLFYFLTRIIPDSVNHLEIFQEKCCFFFVFLEEMSVKFIYMYIHSLSEILFLFVSLYIYSLFVIIYYILLMDLYPKSFYF